MSEKPSKVVIIGGGLAATVLALALQKQDIDSVIYELRHEDAEDSGNLALAPNALRVLDYVGVYSKVRQLGFSYEELTFVNETGAVLGVVLNGSEKLYNFQALRIRRQLVRQLLLQEVQARGIKVHFGMKCMGIESDTDDGVVVRFDNGEHVKASFVVGADGIHSRVRPFVDPAAEPKYTGAMGIGGAFDRGSIPSMDKALKNVQLPCFIHAKEGAFAMMPTDFAGNRIGFFVFTQQADRSREEWAKLSNDKREQSRILNEKFQGGNWPDFILDVCRKTAPQSLSNWPYFAVPDMKSWSSVKGNVVLIGDAAHAIPPTGGQGAAMAFEDAATLAYVLGRCNSKETTRTLLPKWEEHRKARVEQVRSFTARNGDLRKSAASPLGQAIKEWLMWAFLKYNGPAAGAEWLYRYSTESVIGALRA